MRLLVIGGDAGGMSAASTVKRAMGDDIDVVVLERGEFTSYSACGIPYWIGGVVPSRDDLIARSPEEHRRRGIDVRLGAEATSIDLDARHVATRDQGDFAYDRLLIATGAEPIRPSLPGIDAEGLLGVQSLGDGQAVLDAMRTEPRHVVVVGSGYIGLEMAEACVQRGLDVTVIEQAPAPMPLLAPELGEHIASAMRGLGITFIGDSPATAFETHEGRVTAVHTDDGRYPADLVLLGMGVRARSELGARAGLKTGDGDGLLIDDFARAEGRDDVWAAGDCVATYDRLTGGNIHLPLGTHANKQGQVAGKAIVDSLAGRQPTDVFPGVLRTAITKICDVEIGLTGLDEDSASGAGFDPVVASVDSTTIAGYFPGAEQLTIRVVADRASRRLLGGQIIGGTGSAWRIDTLAMALWNEMTVDDLAMTDLAYAPPFSSVWDPVQVAARAAIRQLPT